MAKQRKWTIVYKPDFNLTDKPIRGIINAIFDTRKEAERTAEEWGEDMNGRWYAAKVEWEEEDDNERINENKSSNDTESNRPEEVPEPVSGLGAGGNEGPHRD